MTELTLLDALIGVLIMVTGIAGWFGREKIKSLENSIDSQRLEIGQIKEHYFKKEDFKEFKSELFSRLDKIEYSWVERFNELRKN